MTIRSIQRQLFVLAILLVAAMIGSNSARAANLIVTTTNDSGPGSLRDAINQANINSGPDTIRFAILPHAGVKTIEVQSDLPLIIDTVTIDGSSQGGHGYEGPPLIELRGGARATSVGLTLTLASRTEIRSLLTIVRFVD